MADENADLDRMRREAVAEDRRNYEPEKDTDRAVKRLVREAGVDIDRRGRR